MLFLGNIYYAWMGLRLAKKEGRADICALPSGPSVPHMFIVVYVIMLPILAQTGDTVKAWEAGLARVFLQGLILIGGSFLAPVIRRSTPRAALLGTLAGVSIAFIAMRPAAEIFMTSIIGLTCLANILVSWFGGVRYPRGIPAGRVIIVVGTLIARGRGGARPDRPPDPPPARLRSCASGHAGHGRIPYDVTGENSHEGACRNPRDPVRLKGGSSSGCGAAAAGGWRWCRSGPTSTAPCASRPRSAACSA
ncbi:MAG: amidase family protein [Salipiger thiooxidans]|uniref:amidase family protein n=1 Tax=Salipiger thiooxidans TaxID=282683 RepID=UPI0021F5462D|nr:amidase family protein [Salipiger thiooxidans]